MRNASLTLLATSILLCGCAAGSGSRTSDTRRDPNRITPEEIQEQAVGTAYDVVERLRPMWLRSRSSTLQGGGTVILPRVFVDDRDYGPRDSLRDFHIDSLEEIRFISARDATTRYGTGYAGGIIFVVLKKE